MNVYIINLKSSLDRLKSMNDEINNLFNKHLNLQNKLNFRFFSAIDGRGGAN